MNEDVESYETVPFNIDQIINDIASQNGVPTVIGTVKQEMCEDNAYVQPISMYTYGQEGDFKFLETPFEITPDEAFAAEQLLSLSEGNRLPPGCVPSLDVDVAAVVNEAAAAVIESGQTDFDPDEEQRKLFNLLQISNEQPKEETILPHVRCNNCSKVFEFDNFSYHVCDYGVDQPQLPLINPQIEVQEKLKKPTIELVFPEEHPALRLLRENQIRIRRFLKEELKYEIPSTTVRHIERITMTFEDSGEITTSSTIETIVERRKTQPDPNTSNNGNGNSQNGGNAHECSICDRRFVHASGLLRHMEKHTLDLISSSGARHNMASQSSHCLSVAIKCQLCGRVFFKVNPAVSHLMTHFPNRPSEEIEMDNYMEVPYEAFVDDAIAFLLNEENNSNSQLRQIQEHTKSSNYLKVIILGNVLQCEFCDYIFTDVSYLFLHSAAHSPERRFECLSCEICVDTSKEIFSHFQAECVFMREDLKLLQANTLRYFVCNVCEKKFQALDHLHEHRYAAFHFFPRFNPKIQKLQAPCEFCESVFDNVQDLVFHFEAQHFKKYRRDEFGYSNGHALNKLRQYLCDVCGKSYTQSSHLWQHLRFHQGLKPFACHEPGCSRKFTIRPDLHDHIRKCHTGERPFHCHICGKRFLTGSVFYQHRLIHRGERRYECNQCGKRFYRADALKNHTRIHTGEKPYDCEYCTKSFRQRGDCEKHTRARHAHLDENTRNMLKLQKLNLKAAAAAKIILEQEQQQQQN